MRSLLEHRVELTLPPRAVGVTTDRRVRARVRVPAESAPYVLMVPGYLASMDWAFIPALEQGLNVAGLATAVVTVSGSGFGEDSSAVTELEAFGHDTYEQQLEDLAALDGHLGAGEVPGLDLERRAIWGHSRGSAMALLHAAETGGYRALCTWATVARVGRYDPHRITEWESQGYIEIPTASGQRLRLYDDIYRDYTENAERYDLDEASVRFGGPALFVHGMRDRAVAPAEAQSFAERFGDDGFGGPLGAGARFFGVDDVGHNFGTRHPLRDVGPGLASAIEASVNFLVSELNSST